MDNFFQPSIISCREQYGIPALVKLLEAMPFDAVTAAAADALRALAMNNEANKTAIREAWAVPLLVKLLGSEVSCTHVPRALPPLPYYFCPSTTDLPISLSHVPPSLPIHEIAGHLCSADISCFHLVRIIFWCLRHLRSVHNLSCVSRCWLVVCQDSVCLGGAGGHVSDRESC